MKRLALLLASLFISATLAAESVTVGGQWKGLNNGDSSMMIGDSEAQDLSNVDITESGFGIKKRDGTATFKQLTYSTSPVRGGYYYRDANGTDYIIHAHDKNVARSDSGSAYTNFVTTATRGAYWDFVDSNGVLWGVNSARDEVWKYTNGSLTYYPSHPKGNQIEVTPDRLVIANTAANPNRLAFSKRADFTTFTTGLTADDAWTEDVGLPGQAVQAIKWALGRLYIWTRTSLSFFEGDSQFEGTIEDVSTTVGSDQPSSIVYDQGVIYWQAQDRHFYAHDGSVIKKISRAIAGSVDGFASGESKSWQQTTQSDFQAGIATHTSANISSGDVVLGTYTVTETAAADFILGTLTNTNTWYSVGSVALSTNNTNVTNNSFDSALGTEWTTAGDAARVTSQDGITPQSGAGMLRAGSIAVIGFKTYIRVLDSGGVIIGTHTVSDNSSSCSTTGWLSSTFSLAPYVGKNIKLQIAMVEAGSGAADGTATSELFYCSGQTLSYYYNVKCNGSPSDSYVFLDVLTGGKSTIYDGSYQSKAYNSSFYATLVTTQALTYTANGNDVTFSVTRNGGNVYYTVDFSTTTSSTGLPTFESANIGVKATTGSFISQAKQIGSNATSFGNFARDQTLNDGTLAYSIRTADTADGLNSASWVSLTNDSQITATVRPYVQVKADFTITHATQSPTLSSFLINWNEGTITRTWGTVDKDHRIMWSVAEGTNTAPNATYIYDPRFDSWLKYSLPFDAPARVGDSIYYGGASTGVVYQYPSGTSDSGSAFAAYWKSKDFLSGDAFSEKAYTSLSLIAKTQAGSNVDITYAVNTDNDTSYNVSLTDSNSYALLRNNYKLPSGLFGTFFNFKFGNDDVDSPFEVYTVRYEYTPKPWRVLP